jgi:hypothetical protein
MIEKSAFGDGYTHQQCFPELPLIRLGNPLSIVRMNRSRLELNIGGPAPISQVNWCHFFPYHLSYEEFESSSHCENMTDVQQALCHSLKQNNDRHAHKE